MERWLQRKPDWAELSAVLAEGLLCLNGTLALSSKLPFAWP